MQTVADYSAEFVRHETRIGLELNNFLYAEERIRPGAFDRTFKEGMRALNHGEFSSYKPEDMQAWEYIGIPVRAAFDFESERIHLLAAVVRKVGLELLSRHETYYETFALRGRRLAA